MPVEWLKLNNMDVNLYVALSYVPVQKPYSQAMYKKKKIVVCVKVKPPLTHMEAYSSTFANRKLL